MRFSSGIAIAISMLLLLGACAPRQGRPAGLNPEMVTMNRVAEEYVKLVLALGQHDADYVDAYYGPAAWKTAAEATRVPLGDLRTRAAALIRDLQAVPPMSTDEMVQLRHSYLTRQLQALVSRIDMLEGKRLSFDEESRALYDAVAPTNTEDHFRRVLGQLDRALAGAGPLTDRYQKFRSEFVIPADRLDPVFKAAIAACRARTARHVPLPPEESFTVEYVTGKPWSGYNWYQGNHRSLIQMNTDLPIYIDRALDLACHEGYPGHHVYNSLLEQELVRKRGWVEYSVYPLFSPQSLIAEGSANYGIQIAFLRGERVAFERDTLFALAGLDPARAAEYYRVMDLVQQLSYAGNEAARRYLDGEIDRKAAADWLVRYALMTPEAAEQRVRFFDKYRSYVINYNLGQDLVRAYVEAKAGPSATPEERWRVFRELLASPRLPSDLGTR